ncbi:hypothetical protein [Streptomyces sp. NBC_00354]|uniref:hypothetical protein n=1 Tax=Streptomyces sp. NBC_00354 TaxID=2975723 RepID=UPI002E267763|nr:hypothetical protein OG296_05040 [Streptomyces sp. NBC_01001]
MAAVSSMHLTALGGADVDQEELDELTMQLRRRLLELDVEDVRVRRSGGEVPVGAKPGELIAIGALVVSLAPATLGLALRLVETWMQNRPVRKVTVDIDGHVLDLGLASKEEQRRIVDAYLAYVQTRPASIEDPSAADEAAGVTGGAGEPPALRE